MSGYKTTSVVYSRPELAASAGRSPTKAPTRTGPSSKHKITAHSLNRIRARLGFDKDDLILNALLSGADYAPTGLPGLGSVKTIAIVSHGFGTQLLRGLHELRYRSDEERAGFLGEWRKAVARVLQRDVEGMTGEDGEGV